MKRIILLAVIFTAMAADGQAQTALYKKYTNIKGLNAYCVERFPLGDNDSVTLTYFVADDSSTYNFIKKELQNLPKPSISAELNVTPEKKAIEATTKRDLKAVTIYTRKALTGDKGEYMMFLPSDRKSILVFHNQKLSDKLAVIKYMIDTEFKND